MSTFWKVVKGNWVLGLWKWPRIGLLCMFLLFEDFVIKQYMSKCCFEIYICCFAFDERGNDANVNVNHVMFIIVVVRLSMMPSWNFFTCLSFCCFENMISSFVTCLELWWRCKVVVNRCLFLGFFLWLSCMVEA